MEHPTPNLANQRRSRVACLSPSKALFLYRSCHRKAGERHPTRSKEVSGCAKEVEVRVFLGLESGNCAPRFSAFSVVYRASACASHVPLGTLLSFSYPPPLCRERAGCHAHQAFSDGACGRRDCWTYIPSLRRCVWGRMRVLF